MCVLALCVSYASAGSIGAIAAIAGGSSSGGGSDEGYSYGAPAQDYSGITEEQQIMEHCTNKC